MFSIISKIIDACYVQILIAIIFIGVCIMIALPFIIFKF